MSNNLTEEQMVEAMNMGQIAYMQERPKLHDQFAMAALTGMLANPGRFDATQSLVEYAFELANDCMHEREKWAARQKERE